MSQSKLQTGEKILDKIKVNGLIQEENNHFIQKAVDLWH